MAPFFSSSPPSLPLASPPRRRPTNCELPGQEIRKDLCYPLPNTTVKAKDNACPFHFIDGTMDVQSVPDANGCVTSLVPHTRPCTCVNVRARTHSGWACESHAWRGLVVKGAIRTCLLLKLRLSQSIASYLCSNVLKFNCLHPLTACRLFRTQ